MLVLEGPDMVGKTTIVDKLRRCIPRIAHRKFGLPEAEWIGANNWLKEVRALCVADRMHMSEHVYAKVCRGHLGNLSREDCRRLDKAIRHVNGLVVCIAASPEAYDVILQRHYVKEREAFTAEQCRRVNDEYLRIMRNEGDYHFLINMVWKITLDPKTNDLLRPTEAWLRSMVVRYTGFSIPPGSIS